MSNIVKYFTLERSINISMGGSEYQAGLYKALQLSEDEYMWLDSTKLGFHTHPIFWLWKFVT